MSGCGALFAVFILMKLRSLFNLGEIYVITAGFSIFVSIFCLFGVKNVKYSVSDKSFKERL